MKLNLAAGRQPAGRGEARRYRAWRLIDQSDAGIQHPHDRHFIQCERRITGGQRTVGARRDERVGLDRRTVPPVALVGPVEQPPGRLAVELNKYPGTAGLRTRRGRDWRSRSARGERTDRREDIASRDWAARAAVESARCQR